MSEERVYTFQVDGSPIFVKESQLTKEQIGEHIKRIVEVYNNAPLQSRDYFTRGILNVLGITEELLKSMGLQITLTVPDDDKKDDQQPPSSLIISPYQ